jgi:multiple sugar transport system permease protein/lactose/L-arabinose transport system permease protein
MQFMVGMSLLLAMALDSAYIRYKDKFRTLLILPVSTSFVAYSVVFLLLLNENFGLINYVLEAVGLTAIPWLTDAFWAKVSITSARVWRYMGYNMLIFFAGLQNIPQTLYEAAEMDGANRWQKFRYVTVPQMIPIILFVLILVTIGGFKIFSEPFVMTNGGPGNGSLTIVQYIYREAFQNFNLGYASAASYVLVGIIMVLSYIQMKVGGRYNA